jgi:hypothetical protein
MLDWNIVYEYFDEFVPPEGWKQTYRYGDTCFYVDQTEDLSVSATIKQRNPEETWLTLMIERRGGTPSMDDVTFVTENWGWAGRRWILEFSPGWEEDIPPKIVILCCSMWDDILRRWV